MIAPNHIRFRWTIAAFMVAAMLIAGLVIWQLFETTPARWCAIALNGSPEMATGCFNVLIRLLDIKDHAVMGLLAILGITILCIVAVALNVQIKGSGPGGASIDIGAQTTTVQAEGSIVTVPTPPSSGSPS